MLVSEIHHPNDVSFKYFEATRPKILYNYFKLPGIFVRNYPTTIIRRDGSEREMDWLVLAKPDNKEIFEKMLVNIEHQSSPVDMEKIRAIADYKDYTKTTYGLPVLSVIIMTVDSKSSIKEYYQTKTDILKPIYIEITLDEICERLKNLEDKIINKHAKLSDDESLDLAFLPVFAPKNKGKIITEKVIRLLNEDKTIKKELKGDILYVQELMVRKYFKNDNEGKELMKMIKNNFKESSLNKVIAYERAYANQQIEEIRSETQQQLKESEQQLKENKLLLAQKDKEIAELRKKLKENGIN